MLNILGVLEKSAELGELKRALFNCVNGGTCYSILLENGRLYWAQDDKVVQVVDILEMINLDLRFEYLLENQQYYDKSPEWFKMKYE